MDRPHQVGTILAMLRASEIRRPAMPSPLPTKATTRVHSERWAIGSIDVSAIILGALASGLGGLVYAVDENPVAASFVFIAFAAIIGVVLRESARPHQQT
jgi:hypothetical protein